MVNTNAPSPAQAREGGAPTQVTGEDTEAHLGQGHPSPLEMLQPWEGRGCHPARPGHLNLGAAGSARSSGYRLG